MSGDLILAIDNGTQSVRALLFDLAGNVLAKSRVLLRTHRAEQPGWAEEDPEYFWASLCQACQQLWSESIADPAAPDGSTQTRQVAGVRDRIAALALTTQRSTVINVDRNGKPLRPAIVWLDQRRTYGLQPVGGLWGAGVPPHRHDGDRRPTSRPRPRPIGSAPTSPTSGRAPTSTFSCPAI